MAAGPKPKITAPPLDLSGWPKDRAKRRERFIKEYLVVPEGHGAGRPVQLRDFQKEIVRGAFAPGVRTSLVSLPRGNGKSSLAAQLCLAELFIGPESAQALVVATDQRQASIVVELARRMTELSPELAERVQVFKDRLFVPHTNSTMTALSSEPESLHGWNPSLLVMDEIHIMKREIWAAATSAAGKRPESLTMAISTPAATEDSLMWDLVRHGREGSDPAFYFREWMAPEGCDTADRDAWKVANPALADKRPFLSEDGIEAVRKTLREPTFRQLRLGQWAKGVDSWLPFGAWEALADPGRVVEPGTRIVAGFDGSASGDSTVLIGVTLEAKPHVFPIKMWQNPGDPRWRVPRLDVDETVRDMFRTFDVQELSCDPWGWRSEAESWAGEHGAERVLEWNTASAARMAPATDRLFQTIMKGELSQSGDKALAAHFSNAVAKSTSLGDLVSKDKRNSVRKIDGAVATILAYDRAAFHFNKKTTRRRVVAF